MQRKLTITLKYDADGDYHKAIIESARTAARTLYATSTLVSQKRKPKLTVESESFISGVEVISLDDVDEVMEEVDA